MVTNAMSMTGVAKQELLDFGRVYDVTNSCDLALLILNIDVILVDRVPETRPIVTRESRTKGILYCKVLAKVVILWITSSVLHIHAVLVCSVLDRGRKLPYCYYPR